VCVCELTEHKSNYIAQLPCGLALSECVCVCVSGSVSTVFVFVCDGLQPVGYCYIVIGNRHGRLIGVLIHCRSCAEYT